MFGNYSGPNLFNIRLHLENSEIGLENSWNFFLPKEWEPCNSLRSYAEVKLECGPMPNVMAAQPNIGGAVCESSAIPFLVPRHKVWLMPAARVPCSNAANIGERKTWTQSEFCTWQNSVWGQEPPKMYI